MPRNVAELRAAFDAAMDDDDPELALRYARAALRQSPDAEGWYLLGLSLQACGEQPEAAEAFRTAISLDSEHIDAHVALADDAATQLKFDDAMMWVTEALRIDPVYGAARHLRAMLRERLGNDDGAARDYTSAHLGDPDAWPMPVPLSDETIERIVEEVQRQLHPSLREFLANVPILVEEVPSVEMLTELPDAHAFELLGCFTGRALHEPAGADTWSALPPTITLFRRNLSRFAQSEEELHRELRVTLLHEIGHCLGLDEDDLAERGLS